MRIKAISLGLLFVSLFLLFFLPPLDPDLGWHLRCGEDLWQGKSFCRQNDFSLLLSGHRWPNHFWLYQALLYPVYRLGGIWGLSFFGALLLSGTFFLLFLNLKRFRWESLWGLPLIIFFSRGVLSLGVRSQLAGLFFFNLLLCVLFLPKSSRKLFWLPLIMLFWANTHGSVILGVILLLFHGLQAFKEQDFRFSKKLLLFPLAGMSTLVNPYGWLIYKDAWRHFFGAKLGTIIAEWVAPSPVFQAAVIFIVLVVLLTLVFSKNQKYWLWPLLFIFAAAGLKTKRQIPHFIIISAFLFFSSLPQKLQTSSEQKVRDQTEVRNQTLVNLTLILFLFFSLFLNLPQAIQTNSSWENYCQNRILAYPCGAVDYLKNQKGEEKNLFNRYEWGGFLIWRLPEYKIFVDGRMPAWETPSGKSPYLIYLETLQTQPGWEETLDRYRINWILITPGTFMDLRLAPDPGMFGWKEVFRDKISVVYQKKET